jgi:hypothetical protein
VFISYAREDQPAANLVRKAIEVAGLYAWMDTDIPLHETSFRQHTAKKIDQASAVLVLWSKAASISAWVAWEASRGFSQRKLVQARLDVAEIPPPFTEGQFANLQDWPGLAESTEWIKVLAAIRHLVAASPEPGSKLNGSQSAPPHGEPLSDAERAYLERCRERLVRAFRLAPSLTRRLGAAFGFDAPAASDRSLAELANRLMEGPSKALDVLRKAVVEHRQGPPAESFSRETVSSVVRILLPLVFGEERLVRMRSSVRERGGLWVEIAAHFPAMVEAGIARFQRRDGTWVKVDGDYAWGKLALERPAESGPTSWDRLRDHLMMELKRILGRRSDPADAMALLKRRLAEQNESEATPRLYFIMDCCEDETDRTRYEAVIDDLSEEFPQIIFVDRTYSRDQQLAEDALIWWLQEYLCDE